MVAYPTAYDNLSNPTPTTNQDDPGFEHSTQHGNANDILEALEAVLGLNPQGTYTTVRARLDAGELVTSVLYVGDHTLVQSDSGQAVEFSGTGAANLTIPPNSVVPFPVGTVIEVYQLGTGQVTIVAGIGVTARSPLTMKLASQYSTVSLRKRLVDTWVVAGDLSAT